MVEDLRKQLTVNMKCFEIEEITGERLELCTLTVNMKCFEIITSISYI